MVLAWLEVKAFKRSMHLRVSWWVSDSLKCKTEKPGTIFYAGSLVANVYKIEELVLWLHFTCGFVTGLRSSVTVHPCNTHYQPTS